MISKLFVSLGVLFGIVFRVIGYQASFDNAFCRLPCDFVDFNVVHTVCKRSSEVRVYFI